MFLSANALALLGWASLLVSPWLPRVMRRIAGVAMPSLLALAYAAILLANVGGAEGGLFTLEGIMWMFTQPMIVVMGSLHYSPSTCSSARGSRSTRASAASASHSCCRCCF